MKIRNIFYLALASSLLFASCAKEEATDSFENIKLDKTFVTVDAKGTPVDLTVTATEDWKFIVTDKWPHVFTFKKDENNKTIKPKYDFWGTLTNLSDVDETKTKDAWVTPSVLSGKAGTTKVTLTASAFEGGREITIAILCGTHKQHFVVRQGNLDPVTATCKDINESAIVGASYTVSGIVTKLGNYSKYGAFYVNDGTSTKDVQVYGSTSESIKSFPNVEVGDFVKFSGSWTSYGNFENTNIIKHEKSLAKLLTEPKTVNKAGEDIEFEVAFKGNGVEPSVPEEYQSWISLLGVKIREGEKTKLDPNPASIATITVRVAKNELSERKGQVTVASSTSTVTYEFTQAGAAIVPMVTILVDKFPSKYSDSESEIKVDEVPFLFTNIANYGNGIQLKGKVSSYIANKETLGKKIISVEVVGNSEKPWYPDNVKLYAGTTAKPETGEITPVSDKDNKKLTYDLSGKTYTFFSLKNVSNYTVYFDSVTIIYEE